jgi:hypothetical protein
MFSVGSRVRLLSRIGDYPAGTEAVVVSWDGDVCEVELELGRRYVIQCDALAPANGQAGRAATD